MAFQKGKSGNINGRPKSLLPASKLKECKAQFTAIAVEEVDNWAPRVIRKALEMAEDGDPKMIAMLWDKFFDIKCDNRISRWLGTQTAQQISDSEDVVISKIASGEIDQDYGLGLMKALATKRESIIVRDLESYVNMQKAKEANPTHQ